MAQDPARSAAVQLMTGVTADGHLLSAALPKQIAELAPEVRARAMRLATESLRWAARADRLLSPHLRLKPDDHTMNALRLALYEINVAETPVHAAVHAVVSVVPERKRGLVNGVLRNVQRRETEWGSLPLPVMPKWLRKPLVATYGKDVVAKIEAAHAAGAPLDLTLKKPIEGLEGVTLPTGSLRIAEPGQVSALPGYEAGDWWVQDAAAALPVRLLEPKSGALVLDLCAAPGGKTMQLAQSGAQVIALDSSEARVNRLKENLARTKLEAELVVADALSWTPDAAFDAVLLDAPCTATGTLRRHPDLPYAKDGSTLSELVALQAQLLDRALGWLNPGGFLVYCTCSLLPEEGEQQVEAALSRHADIALDMPDTDWIDPDWKVATGLRTRPDHWADLGGLDGFFLTRFRKFTQSP